MKSLLALLAATGVWITADGQERALPCPTTAATALRMPEGCSAPMPGVLLTRQRYEELVAFEAGRQTCLDALRACEAERTTIVSDCAADLAVAVGEPIEQSPSVWGGLWWCGSCGLAAGVLCGVVR